MKNIFISCVLLLSFCSSLSAKKNIVFLVGERFNSTSQTMPSLAVSLEETYKHKTYYINIPKNGPAENIQLIEKADLLICYLHLRNLPKNQLKKINQHIEAGKPVIAFNSTSQAFEHEPGWFADYFGGGFRAYTKGENKSTVNVIPEHKSHPIFKGLEEFGFQTSKATTIPGPLHKNATPLLMGKSDISPAFPVAWTFSFENNSKLFYTSLGTANDFKNRTFIKIINNAVEWCLSESKYKAQGPKKYPNPPLSELPSEARYLFDGSDLNQWRHWDLLQKPQCIEIDEKIQKFSNINMNTKPRWKTRNNVLITNLGRGDLITKKSYGDYLLSLDFLIPEEPEFVDQSFRGTGGVFISGRYEIRIKPGKKSGKTGPNSIYGTRAPDHEIDMKPGVWHNMKIRYRHVNGAPAVLNVFVNGKTLHGNIKLKERTPYGIIEAISTENPNDMSLYTVPKDETAKNIKMDQSDFTVATRFRTESASGTLFARTSEATGWERDGKALFIGKGKVYYDIGWTGTIDTNRVVNDGKWHHAILTNTKDMCTMFVDGEVTFMKKKFSRPDPADHVFKIGYEFKNFYRPFNGEISNVRFYNRALKYDEIIQLSEKNTSPPGAVLDWRPDPQDKVTKLEENDKTILKGPIRLHGDFSRIRYANIWIKEF